MSDEIPLQIIFQPKSMQELESTLLRLDQIKHGGDPAAPPSHDQFGTALQLVYCGPEIWDIHSRVETHDVTPLSMIAMRMKWGVYGRDPNTYREGSIPFQHISVHAGQEKVFVFVVVNGKSVTIEDDPKLFPSDTLVTQLTMLETNNVDRG
jgi:hypothetical protein